MKKLIYVSQLSVSILLSLIVHYRFENVLLTLFNIDSTHSLFVYVFKNVKIYGRQCPKFLFEIGDKIKTFNQNINIYEYKTVLYTRYIYYVLMYIININTNYLLYGYGKRYIDTFTILLATPYLSKTILYPYTYQVYKTIDKIVCIMICKVIASLLNMFAKNFFKLEPKIDYKEMEPYVLSTKKFLYIQKFLGSLICSVILICLEKYGFIYSTKFIKNVYSLKIVRKNKQKSIENIFITRRWDKLIDPIVLNDFYYVYNKLNDVDYPIEKQIRDVIGFILHKCMEVYYLHYMCQFINMPCTMPILLFLFYKFNPYVFSIVTIISYYHNTVSLLVFECIYYVNNKTIYAIIDDSWDFLIKRDLLNIDLSVIYIIICSLCSYVISYNTSIFLTMFIILNGFYEYIHSAIYSKLIPCSNISYDKHKILTGLVILLGYLSEYWIMHVVSIPIILNCYSYFIWQNARYKKKEEDIKYVEIYFEKEEKEEEIQYGIEFEDDIEIDESFFEPLKKSNETNKEKEDKQMLINGRDINENFF